MLRLGSLRIDLDRLISLAPGALDVIGAALAQWAVHFAGFALIFWLAEAAWHAAAEAIP